MTKDKAKHTEVHVWLKALVPTERYGNKELGIEITKHLPQTATVKEIEEVELELEKFVEDRIDLYYKKIKGLLDFDDFEKLKEGEENGERKKEEISKTGGNLEEA